MHGARPGLARFLPPVLWMGVIALGSSALLGSDRTGSWFLAILAWILPGAGPEVSSALHAVFRKLGHPAEYGVLAILWRRALEPGRASGRAAGWALLLSAGYAIVDEARQGLVPTRSPSAWDVGIDTLGAGLALAWAGPPGRLTRATLGLGRALASALALGSLAAAAVDLALGLPAWDLGLAAGGLVTLAWGLACVERAWRRAA